MKGMLKSIVLLFIGSMILVQCKPNRSVEQPKILKANQVKNILFIGDEIGEKPFSDYLNQEHDNIEVGDICKVINKEEYYNRVSFANKDSLPKDIENIDVLVVSYKDVINSEEIQAFLINAFENKIGINIYNCESEEFIMNELFGEEKDKGAYRNNCDIEIGFSNEGEPAVSVSDMMKNSASSNIFQEIIYKEFIDHRDI